jgi:hypothetical protein
MKERMLKFVIKQIETKISALRNGYTDEELVYDDLNEYLHELKELIFEVVEP